MNYERRKKVIYEPNVSTDIKSRGRAARSTERFPESGDISRIRIITTANYTASGASGGGKEAYSWYHENDALSHRQRDVKTA